jgi:catechol 2,3-dioxygenase-like lactoylglutathione lyase family enzyme
VRARYVHTNLVARDWRRLADFYVRVFGCTPVPPERDLSGSAMDAATGVPGVRIRGLHLRLPGFADGGPTLEIFEYAPGGPSSVRSINRAGFAHLAFQVDDVVTAASEVIAGGGGTLGECVAVPVAGAGVVTFVYVTDPEGNIVELQSWKDEART